jgi:hypothetical protein
MQWRAQTLSCGSGHRLEAYAALGSKAGLCLLLFVVICRASGCFAQESPKLIALKNNDPLTKREQPAGIPPLQMNEDRHESIDAVHGS